jgi:hypothetical protein
VLDLLAEMRPEYLKNRLRDPTLPFWKRIPGLKVLGLNGSAVGHPDFSQEILEKPPHTIFQFGQVYQGKLFHGTLAMGSPERRPEWRKALPLFEPLLTGPDTATRRLVVALYRTYGVPVTREGTMYTASFENAPAPKQIRLELEPRKQIFKLGQPSTMVVNEVVLTDEGWISHQGSLKWEVHSKSGSTHSGGSFGSWDEVDLALEHFVPFVVNF